MKLDENIKECLKDPEFAKYWFEDSLEYGKTYSTESRYDFSKDSDATRDAILSMMKTIRDNKRKNKKKEYYDIYLKAIALGRINSLDNARKEALISELNGIINNGSSLRILIAFLISNYLRSEKEYFIVRSNLASSYLAYELGIHDVDCFNYEIIPQLCHGINYNNQYKIAYDVGGNNYKRIMQIIEKNIFEDELVRVYSVKENKIIIENERVLLLDNSLKQKIKEIEFSDGNKYRYINKELINKHFDKAIIINIKENEDLTILNKISKTFKNPRYLKIEEVLDEKNNILNNVIDYYTNSFDKKKSLFSRNDTNISNLIKEFKPKTLIELANVISLAHGTDAQLFQELLLVNGYIKENELIGSKDDVYQYLINKGVSKVLAINIMEDVSKGKGISSELNSFNIDKSFYETCNNIKYLFPRANALALVNVGLYLEYYMEYYPNEFKKARDFDFDKGFILEFGNSNQEFFWDEYQKRMKKMNECGERWWSLDNDK